LQAELSGNNAAIIWHDTDLVRAAEQMAWGAFAFAGQRCTANRRAIVHGPVLEAFVEAVAATTARLAWGDPLEASTDLGPLIDVAKRDEVAGIVTRAQTSGVARRVLWPKAAQAGEAWVTRGAYAQPAIVCCDRSDHALVQEETMGPLLVVQQAADFTEALALCNGVRHGLAAALFTRSPELQERFREEAHAGILKLNTSTAGADITLPFGGWKASGVGPPEHGAGDVLFYTRMQAVYADGG
jgi:acyl-CoA reductase-like NAD-dependent aldehyde dehydrogenase